MDTFSIIQGIHFSWCSDAGKTYYIINTLYNAINIWCHKSASCLLGLPASGVWVLQSNRMSFIRLQQERGVYICFPLTVENTTGINISFFFYWVLIHFYKASFHTIQEDCDSLFSSTALCNVWSLFVLFFTFVTSLLLLHHKPPLHIAGLVQVSLPLLLHSLDNQFTLTWPG